MGQRERCPKCGCDRTNTVFGVVRCMDCGASVYGETAERSEAPRPVPAVPRPVNETEGASLRDAELLERMARELEGGWDPDCIDGVRAIAAKLRGGAADTPSPADRVRKMFLGEPSEPRELEAAAHRLYEVSWDAGRAYAENKPATGHYERIDAAKARIVALCSGQRYEDREAK